MDLTETIAPKSDQLNAEDLLTGPRTFTIKEVTGGSVEQPVNVHLVELPGRPYRPSKSMRRIMVAAWGKDTSPYAGRRLTLYRDPKVRFGADEVGGIKISHLSNIDKRMSLALTVTRGKRAAHVVDPLPDAAPTPQSATAETIQKLNALFGQINLDAQARPAYIADVIGRSISGYADLGQADAEKVIAAIEADLDQPFPSDSAETEAQS